MARGYSYTGSDFTYVDYLSAHEFVNDIKDSSKQAAAKLSFDISQQTLAVIASNESLARENIEATHVAADKITETMRSELGALSSVMQDGFSELTYEMQGLSEGIERLNATFHWGFSEMIASMGRMNDSIDELIKIAKTPAQTAAYEQYEIAQEAFRQKLGQECLEALDKAINGDQSSSGYKLEWRFHTMKGTVRLGFVGGDMSLVDPAEAEESFLLAGRYAKADHPEHAAQAFLSAGWSAYCQGKLKDALLHTEQALKIIPNLGEALFQSAKINIAIGEVPHALSSLKEAIEIDRFYSLKAAGDGDFQKHDSILRDFLESMRTEKYNQLLPLVQKTLKKVERILAIRPEGKINKELESFTINGESLPLLDLLAIEKDLENIVSKAKTYPIIIKLKVPRIVSESFKEEESYQERVVVREKSLFKKEIAEMQTKTRLVEKTKKVKKVFSIDFEFCHIPPGTFLMNANGANYARKVAISKGFFIGKYPVTQLQWESVMGYNPSSVKGENNPVETVSWSECQKFISELNKHGCGIFRLPTEAEWEYASRAGSETAYFFGEVNEELGDFDPYPRLDEYAWYVKSENIEKDEKNNFTMAVGLKKPNPWGLYDIYGNVWEWCQDFYNPDIYSPDLITDPLEKECVGRYQSDHHVLRGGSIHCSWRWVNSCRVNTLCHSGPEYIGRDHGLRIVLMLDE